VHETAATGPATRLSVLLAAAAAGVALFPDGDASTHLVLAAQRERQDSGESEHQDEAQLVKAD
jgi:hypothetical protein